MKEIHSSKIQLKILLVSLCNFLGQKHPGNRGSTAFHNFENENRIVSFIDLDGVAVKKIKIWRASKINYMKNCRYKCDFQFYPFPLSRCRHSKSTFWLFSIITSVDVQYEMHELLRSHFTGILYCCGFYSNRMVFCISYNRYLN